MDTGTRWAPYEDTATILWLYHTGVLSMREAKERLAIGDNDMHKFDVLCKDKYMEGRMFVLHVEADDEQGALQAALDKFKNNDYKDYTPVAVARRNGEWGQWLKTVKLPNPVKPHVTNTHYKG